MAYKSFNNPDGLGDSAHVNLFRSQASLVKPTRRIMEKKRNNHGEFLSGDSSIKKMKFFAHIIILVFNFSACIISNEKPNHNATIKNPETKTAKKFFQYDQVDHYFIDFNDNDLLELIEKKPLSPLDSIKNITIIGEDPQKINDNNF